MSLVVQTNVASLEAQKNLSMTQKALTSSFEKLSSGYRINTRGGRRRRPRHQREHEDADPLLRGRPAQRERRDSMAQTAEGSLGEVSGILGRMRELAMQGSNGSLQTSDRGYLDTEFQSLKAEIKRIQGSTTFNNQQLLQTGASTIAFQVGINTGANNQHLGHLRQPEPLGAPHHDQQGRRHRRQLDGGPHRDRRGAEDGLDLARGLRRGDEPPRHHDQQPADDPTNTAAANSRIRDVDVAEETSAMSREQVLAQAGASVLAQANQAPQLAMSLLR